MIYSRSYTSTGPSNERILSYLGLLKLFKYCLDYWTTSQGPVAS